MEQKPTELEKPAGAKPSGDEPVIHVIPEKFHGAALRKKLPKTPVMVPTAPGAAVPPGTPVVPSAPAKPKKGPWIVVAVLGVLLLGAGGAVAFLLLGKEKEPPAPVCGDKQCAATESPFSCPADCGPPPPVCGDKQCNEPQESAQTCAADCGPPPPVCGDRRCEGSESPQNCPADCGPPPPVCGDNKCEQSETFENCPADCLPPEPTPGLDSDSDGLTDEEEQQVFGTNPNDPNTDKDSFVDLNEALNLFDPARPAPSSLRDNPGVAVYVNDAQGYEIFRPSTWSVREGEDAKKEVFFNATSGEFIEVLVQDKDQAQPLLDWFLAQAPGVTSSQIELFKTKQGYDVIMSPDRFTAYVDAGNGKVWVVSYNLGKRFEIQYKVTFQMMVQSLDALAR